MLAIWTATCVSSYSVGAVSSTQFISQSVKSHYIDYQHVNFPNIQNKNEKGALVALTFSLLMPLALLFLASASTIVWIRLDILGDFKNDAMKLQHLSDTGFKGVISEAHGLRICGAPPRKNPSGGTALPYSQNKSISSRSRHRG